MNLLSLNDLAAWGMLLAVGAHLVAGIVLGVVYFRSLWWNARLFVLGGPAIAAVACTIGRVVLLVGLLALASLEGVLPLLAIAVGVLTARPVVMHWFHEVAP